MDNITYQIRRDNTLIKMDGVNVIQIWPGEGNTPVTNTTGNLWVEVPPPVFEVGQIVEDKYGSGQKFTVGSYYLDKDTIAYVCVDNSSGTKVLKKHFEIVIGASTKEMLALDSLYPIDIQPKNP